MMVMTHILAPMAIPVMKPYDNAYHDAYDGDNDDDDDDEGDNDDGDDNDYGVDAPREETLATTACRDGRWKRSTVGDT